MQRVVTQLQKNENPARNQWIKSESRVILTHQNSSCSCQALCSSPPLYWKPGRLRNQRTREREEKCNLVQMTSNHSSVFRPKVPLALGPGPRSLGSSPGPMRTLRLGPAPNSSPRPHREPWELASLISGKHTRGITSFPPSTPIDYWALFSVKPPHTHTQPHTNTHKHTLSLSSCVFLIETPWTNWSLCV